MQLNSTIFETQQVANKEANSAFVFGHQVVRKSSPLVYLLIGIKESNALIKHILRTKFFPFLIFTVLISCDQVQNKLDSTASEIEYAENNLLEMSGEDWTKLELSMEELEQDLELNRNEYSEEQIKEAGKIQGKYAALVIKKGMNDLQESVEDFGNQMEGFIEGINSDTTNN